MMLRAARRVSRVSGGHVGGVLLNGRQLLLPQLNGGLLRGQPSTYQLISAFSTGVPGDSNKDGASGTSSPHKAAVEVKAAEKSKMAVVVNGLKSLATSTKEMILNPRATWAAIKHEVNHYWMGSKLLWSEIKITKDILHRVLQGHGMTRRERKQLVRTSTDIFRLVPFAIFVIVPFMELTLPFFLKFFPNMLPSTFQDSLKKEESMKKELQVRLSVAKFMQEALQEMANKQAGAAEGDKASGAKEIIDFIHKAQQGQPVPTEHVLRIARLFHDDLTLDNISRPQLVSLCTYMGLQSYGSDNLLRFLLRSKLRKIKEDDRRILWEGIDSLNTLELREACAERGMRSLGLTQFQLKHQLSEWLELSTAQGVPISLLIMSRALTLSHVHELPTQVLRSSLSSLDSDTINEVVIASAKGGEEDSLDIRRRKLDSLKFQQEMIDEERAKAPVVLVQPTPSPAPSVSAPTPVTTTVLGKEVAVGASLGEEGKLTLTLPADQQTVVVVKPAPSVAPTSTPVTAPLETAPVTTAGEVEAPAVVVPTPTPVSKKKELTLEEMQALVDLARGSSLQREKSELNILQATIEAVLQKEAEAPTPAALSAPAADAASTADADRLNRGVDRMRGVLNNMLKQLEARIDRTEKAVGEAFNVLDRDGDGQLTAHELREAIVRLLRREFSLQEADQLIDLLDDDKDGKVSLVELLHHIEQRREALQMLALQPPQDKGQDQGETQTLPAEQAAGSRLVNKD